jgi:hypothetical protein
VNGCSADPSRGDRGLTGLGEKPTLSPRTDDLRDEDPLVVRAGVEAVNRRVEAHGPASAILQRAENRATQAARKLSRGFGAYAKLYRTYRHLGAISIRQRSNDLSKNRELKRRRKLQKGAMHASGRRRFSTPRSAMVAQ